MLDLRLMGIAGRTQGIAEFSEQLFPWTWTGLGIVLAGGLMLFSAAAASYLENPAFRIKFPLVLTGIAVDVDSDGALILETQDGNRKKIVAGDVQYNRIEH